MPFINDGRLTAAEIAQLVVGSHLRLVVLSACETGMGEPTRGQGVRGLRSAFLLAGAHSVLSTLWSVSDEVTPDWMAQFYRALASGRSRVEAVHEARLAVRARNPHPDYWGSFILEGETGPIRFSGRGGAPETFGAVAR